MEELTLELESLLKGKTPVQSEAHSTIPTIVFSQLGLEDQITTANVISNKRLPARALSLCEVNDPKADYLSTKRCKVENNNLNNCFETDSQCKAQSLPSSLSGFPFNTTSESQYPLSLIGINTNDRSQTLPLSFGGAQPSIFVQSPYQQKSQGYEFPCTQNITPTKNPSSSIFSNNVAPTVNNVSNNNNIINNSSISNSSQTINPCTTPTPLVCNNPRKLQQIWNGKLALENCPQKGKCKDIYVSAFAPNVCCPNIDPLIAQFEGTYSTSPASKWPTVFKISGVCASTNLNFFKKYSLRIFILFPEKEIQGNFETFHFLLQQLSKNSWAGVVDLPENTLLLVPFRNEKLLGILLTKMNVTLANRALLPTLGQFTCLSSKYHKEGHLRFEDEMPDGFYDPGRSTEFMYLEEYKKQTVNTQSREILLVDANVDPKLTSYVKRAEEMLSCFTDLESQARVLSLFVSNCFGGDFPSTDSCIQEIAAIKQARKSNIVPIGEISKGVCRHRAILYKYLCDKFSIDCELKRGNYSGVNATGAHSWNVIKLGMQYFVVDIMHEPTQLYSLDSEKAKNYIRIDNVDGELKVVRETDSMPLLRPELSSRRFVRLPNLREKACFHERLGRGGYGSVYRITLGGLACALKKIDIGKLTEKQKTYALQEVQVMEMLQHENIIRYLGHELLEDKKELHILMELFPLSLGQLIERRRKNNHKFLPCEIKHLGIEILNGIDHLHNQQIIHRDLKSDNILVDMDENGKINKVKITDFGVCKIVKEEHTDDQTRVGTELYMPPEVHITAQYSFKADIFSFGMVLVELVTLSPPYFGLPRDVALKYLKSGILPSLPDEKDLSLIDQKIVAIIKSCLSLDPEKRPTAEQLIISFFRLQCL